MNRYIRIFLAAAVVLLVISSSRANAQSGTTDQQGRQITCASDDGNRHYCPIDTRGGVQMVNQRSGSSCIQGQTWGWDRNGIWVDRGCRADFIVNPYWNNGPGSTITCSSDDGQRNYCRTNTQGGVRMVNQRSGSPCIQGQTWGWDRGGIWVDRGCRADFAVGSNNGFPGGGGSNSITCSSDNGQRNYCRANTNGGVRLVRQRSTSPCVQGQTWGWDRGGIWVDQGCRAEFVTGR